jgi:catechol 2,3-dioxygenase-like lactoylglutathione lyase family enzyme
MSFRVNALDHAVINVRDVEVSASWYQITLGMIRHDSDPKPGETPRTSLTFGHQKINLRPVTISKEVWFTADNETAGSDDLCFLTHSGPDAVVSHLGALGIAVEEGPVHKQGATGMLTSVYCRDPDGNLIEISSYADAEANSRSD